MDKLLTRAQRRIQTDLILRAYNALPEFESGWRNWNRELMEAFTASERQHRRGHPPAGITVGLAAKQQMVRWLAQYVTTQEPEDITALLDIRHDVCLAAAVAHRYREQILGAWAAAGIDPAAVLAVDYAALMRTE